MLRLLALLGCTMWCHTAWADRSRLAEGAEAIEAGDCELETAFERSRARAAATMTERETSVQLDCGIGWGSELVAAVTGKRVGAGVGGTERSFSLEGKTLLRERRAADIGWALVYGVQSDRTASAWRRAGHFVSLEATLQPQRGWLLEGQFGYARDRAAAQDRSLWAIGVEHALTEQIELRLNLGGDDRSRPSWRAALRLEVWPEQVALTVSYAGSTERSRRRSLGLALTFEF